MIATLGSRAWAFAVLLAMGASVTPARAQDATWTGATNSLWEVPTNWTPNAVPTSTATFILGPILKDLVIGFDGLDRSINTMQFDAAAPRYTFSILSGVSFNINGSGVVNNSLFSPIFTNQGTLNFNNASTAGNAEINNLSLLSFNNTSSAGTATITNNLGSALNFFDASTAGSASITNTGILVFNDTSTAGNAVITNNNIMFFANASSAGNANISNSLILQFVNTSTAGNATITNNLALNFADASTAGNATINNNAGILTFNNTSTAGNATITNNLAGILAFSNASTAGNATITNQQNVVFRDTSTAGNATIINNQTVNFDSASTAGSATITNNQFLNFFGTSTADNASIFNNNTLRFRDASTAGNATITNNSGATTFFLDNSTGGNARLIANANSAVDFSGTLGPAGDKKVSAGSIEGAGTYFLGSNQLTVGNNNLSTTVSGTIQDGGASAGAGGSLVKVGSGTLMLTGTNTYSGATTVNAGTLFVNGSIANSAVTVNSGATLAGIGTVGATTINSGGIFAPGTSPGTMTVQGNLAFQSGALYLVQVDPSTASSTNVTAGGSAALAGTVQAAFASGSYMSRTYTILSAAGGLNGTTFNTLTTTNLPAGFTASLSYTATDAILNLTATLGQPSAPGAPGGPNALGTGGLSINQLNVANSLNTFFNNGGTLPPGFVTIFGLTGGNLANALSELSGEAATGAQKVGFQLTDQFLNLMLDPFVDGRSGVGGTDHPALGFAPEREAMPPEIALAYASVFKAPPKPVPVYEPRWTVWGGAYGGSNRTTGDLAVIGSHDLSARTVGGAGGLDYRLSPDTVVGLAFAGGGTDWSLSQGLGGGKSDAFQAGIYGATKSGPAYLAAAFAFANHWMSTDRIAFAGDHLTADFNAQSYGGRLEGGYRFATPYGGITPYAAIQAQSFHTPSYTETGVIPNGFALTFASRDATDTRSELGARFDRVVALYPNAVLALRGRVAWAHDWVSDPTLAAVFQTLPGASFIVNGATPAQNSALTSAGAELRLANGVTLLAKFDGEFASHSSTYGGTGTIRYRW
jgi:autotransporter-associated beta strand protein